MVKTEELTELLRRLNRGEDPVAVREEAREFLATVDTRDLSIAEQNLLDEGLSPSDLRRLCTVHLEMLGDQVEKMKSQLPVDHVISTLISEHETILCFLDDLEVINEKIQRLDEYSKQEEAFRKLAHIAEHLVAADLHYQREEDILFPELERKGVYGPPVVMREEHTQLKRRKVHLKELTEKVGTIEFADFKRRLGPLVEYIVPTLRDHIFKENNILYPTALSVIDDEAIWRKLKAECDKIGYCCFTPHSGDA